MYNERYICSVVLGEAYRKVDKTPLCWGIDWTRLLYIYTYIYFCFLEEKNDKSNHLDANGLGVFVLYCDNSWIGSHKQKWEYYATLQLEYQSRRTYPIGQKGHGIFRFLIGSISCRSNVDWYVTGGRIWRMERFRTINYENASTRYVYASMCVCFISYKYR